MLIVMASRYFVDEKKIRLSPSVGVVILSHGVGSGFMFFR